jgi:cytochrome c556
MKKLIAIGLAMAISPALMAQEYNPEMLIKYRQDFMKAMGGHNNDIKGIVNGAVPYKGHLNMHLTTLEQMFIEVGNLFPEGSDFGETNAKDSIWEQPEKFNKAVTNAQQALAEFKQVASQGDMAKTKAAFRTFGRTSCGGCHKEFKKKQN